MAGGPCRTRTRRDFIGGTAGALAFEWPALRGDGRRVAVPISLVEKFVGIPISWNQKTGDVARSAAAGGGTAY